MPESLTASWFSALTRAREGSCEKLGASKGTDAVPFLVEAPSHLKSVPHGNGERGGERSLQGIRNFFTASGAGGIRARLRLDHLFIPGPRWIHRSKNMETQRAPRAGGFMLTSLKVGACL